MQAQAKIKFEELLKIVKNLPESKLSKLKAILSQTKHETNSRSTLETLLLQGPTFSKKQFETIAKTRKAINQWRSK